MSARWRWSVALLLAIGCGPATRGPMRAPAAAVGSTDPRPAESTRRCTIAGEDWRSELDLDARGFIVSRYDISDAAGTQYEERFTRDADGREIHVVRSAIEGVVDGLPEADTTYGMHGSRVVAHTEDALGDPVRRTWTYDADGRPASYEEQTGDEPATLVTCAYDSLGRVVQRGGDRFVYPPAGRTPVLLDRGDGDRWGIEWSSREISIYPEDAEPLDDEYAEEGDLLPDETRWSGACSDLFFAPCSPTHAPPPPTGERAASRGPSWRASLDEVVALDLDCGRPDDEERPCEAVPVHRVDAEGTGGLHEVVILHVRDGFEEAESHYLATRTDGGWRLGARLADGPFNGNQMTGTFSFETESPSLTQVVPDDEAELTVRYATTFHEEIPEVGELETEERGILLCTGLRSRLRCARIPVHVRDVCEDLDRTREATADVRFPGDGTVVIQASGEHPRVIAGARPIESLFTDDPAPGP